MTSEQVEALREAHLKIVQGIEALQLAERVLGAPDKSWMSKVEVRVVLPDEALWEPGAGYPDDVARTRLQEDLATLMQENFPLFAETLLKVRRAAVEPLVVPAQMPPTRAEAPADA